MTMREGPRAPVIHSLHVIIHTFYVSYTQWDNYISTSIVFSSFKAFYLVASRHSWLFTRLFNLTLSKNQLINKGDITFAEPVLLTIYCVKKKVTQLRDKNVMINSFIKCFFVDGFGFVTSRDI